MIFESKDMASDFSYLVYETFNSHKHVCIDGFGNSKSKCVTIIPALVRKHQIYNDCKAAVVILSNDNLVISQN